MSNQAQEARVTPSGLTIPADFTAYQAEYMLVIDTAVTEAAVMLEREYPSSLALRAQADEYERKGTGTPFLIERNREQAALIDKGYRYFAIVELLKVARAGGHGTRAMFLADYLKLLEAAMERQAELTALASHVFYGAQFNPSDDTWAAIKVYRDGNPIVLDDGFKTQDEAEDCADLARDAELEAHRTRRVVAATSIVGGELVVCDGDANGPVIGRFPRTEEGHRAAVALADAEG